LNKKYKVCGTLENTDYIMNNTFFLGTYPGLTAEMFDYIELIVDEFIKSYLKVHKNDCKKILSKIVSITNPIENTYTVEFRTDSGKYKYHPDSSYIWR